MYDCYSVADVSHLHIVYGINIPESIDFAVQCRLLGVLDDNSILITPEGKECLSIFKKNSMCLELWMHILKNYICYSKPSWGGRIPSGRNEAYTIMGIDEKRCFQESGLMDAATPEIVGWWDEIAALYRDASDADKLKTGRRGERLSIQYEKYRTSIDPIWKSIDNNLVGYDIISKLSAEEDTNIYIEVKSSDKSIEYASFYLSRNEWLVASNHNNNYFFHLWLLGAKTRLAVLTIDDINKHVPLDLGAGKWTGVEVPFSEFAQKFIEYHCEDN